MSMDCLCKVINEQEVGDQPRITAEMLEMVQKDHVQLTVNVPLPKTGLCIKSTIIINDVC